MTSTTTTHRAVTFDLAKNTLCQWEQQTLSIEDISKVYYVREDYERIEDDNDLALYEASQMKSKKELQESTTCCVRGLECKTPMGAKRRSTNKKRSRQVVLQNQHDDVLPEVLAEVYSGYSKACQIQANRLGKYDEMIAKQIYQEDDQQQQQQQESCYIVENLKDSMLINMSSSSSKNKQIKGGDDDSTVSTAVESLGSLSF